MAGQTQAASGGFGLEHTTGSISGKVTDAAGHPIAGAQVKIFEQGLKIAEVSTGADGAYSVEFQYVPDVDWTMVIWFVPPQEMNLVAELVILRESLKSKELELWSPCLPRLELRPSMKYDVTLLDPASKRKAIASLEDCGRRRPRK